MKDTPTLKPRKKTQDQEQPAATQTLVHENPTETYTDPPQSSPFADQFQQLTPEDFLTKPQTVQSNDPDRPIQTASGEAASVQSKEYLRAESDRIAAENNSSINPPVLMPSAKDIALGKRGKLEDLQNAPIEAQSRWRSLLVSGLLGLGKAFSGRDTSDWSKFSGAAAEAGTYAVGGAIDKKLGNRFKRELQINNAQRELSEANKEYETDLGQRTKESGLLTADAQRKNLDEDNRRQEEFNRSKIEHQKMETERKIGDRDSREKTSRMNAVAGLLKNLPAYDPADPKFAEITKALGDVGLPLTPKDAKKNVKLVQDQRTGEWTTVLTDPISGRQETRGVLKKDGTPLKTTPSVVMQGEYGLLKQNDQQKFQSGENEKNRSQAMIIARERIGVAKQNLQLAQQRLAQAAEKDKQQAQMDLDKQKAALIKLRGYLQSSPLIDPEDPLFGELDELNK